MLRPDWDTTWLAVAQQVAKRSLCSRAQVGAVIVTADNRVIATGYNSAPAGFNHGGLPCTEWCKRAQPREIIGWSSTGMQHVPDLTFEGDGVITLTTTGQRLSDLDLLRMGFKPEYTPLSPEYQDCFSLHAEANALMAADRSTWQGGTVYVTGDVCHACAKLLANSGLARVVVQRDGVDRSYRTAEVGYDLLRACGLTVEVLDHEQEGEPT